MSAWKCSGFPNILSILLLQLTFPVGTCSCERSFSSLTRLKTWLRTTMTEKRLNGLALMSIHSESDTVRSLSPLSVLKHWDGGSNRKIAFAFDSCLDL